MCPRHPQARGCARAGGQPHFPTGIPPQFLPSHSLGPSTTGAVGAQGGAAPAQGSVSLRLAQGCQAKQEAVSTAEITLGPTVCFPAGLLHTLTVLLRLLQQRHPERPLQLQPQGQRVPPRCPPAPLQLATGLPVQCWGLLPCHLHPAGVQVGQQPLWHCQPSPSPSPSP